MGATYLALGLDAMATFSLFVRKLPARRSYLVVAGLEGALAALRELSFDEDAAKYLRATGRFDERQLAGLVSTRFTGDVWAVPEGRVVFGGEPMLEVQARLIEAQLVETLLLSAIHYPTLVATKAARCVSAAPGKVLVDFGMRRMPSIDASVAAARACYLAGFASTTNVLAGRVLGIPISGTVAHSLIEVFPSEVEAFRNYSITVRGGMTLLVDTYDTLAGVRRAIQVARELHPTSAHLDAIRLDSGDLADLAGRARRMLDEAGLTRVRIVASGGLDEYELKRLEAAGAPIDRYGVGTRLGMSADAPVMDMAYKIVSYGGRPCLKLSEGKATLIGSKQVWRRRAKGGRFIEDLVAAKDEPAPGPDWEPMLEPVVSRGAFAPSPSLREVRLRHEQEMRSLPRELLELDARDAAYPVRVSPSLEHAQRLAVDAIMHREDTGGR
jgi:nicotinate phosphoribosyltransferase